MSPKRSIKQHHSSQAPSVASGGGGMMVTAKPVDLSTTGGL
ncbi:hypothetical protein FOPG_20073 [Fusarium oxysporum f. sp. conglutinans race 2 54008]|uniref:Uncharacterized protein n=1 Tax=Fusarium oxysporum f. sp. conglutinans race 2 54008 TaxID=1089457 RepID=X0HR00_FUSOX|nr:hypothetical protein FOPG_20073 [Fusarium oxysporum f. sp. conglutinans race 2 54008]